MPFSKAKINSLSLKNRFIRSATWEGMAKEDGSVTERLLSLYKRLAKANIGLIITGHTYISEEGKATPRQLGIYSDDLIDGLSKIAKEVHQNGGKIILQLAHAGVFGIKKITGLEPIDINSLGKKDIKELIKKFCLAAERAKEAGFDGIQLHAAHGYLISQFFSPIFNKRKDEFGGSVRNRARFAEEIIKEIRKTLGQDYLVLVKMNCQDFSPSGLTINDSIEIAKIMVKEGVDAIEISGGLLTSKENGPCRNSTEPYFLEQALQFKDSIDVPIILVGGIRSYEQVKLILSKGIEFVAMSRPFICEPELIKRWEKGDLRDSLCISDNLCLKVVKGTDPVMCKRRDEYAKTNI